MSETNAIENFIDNLKTDDFPPTEDKALENDPLGVYYDNSNAQKQVLLNSLDFESLDLTSREEIESLQEDFLSSLNHRMTQLYEYLFTKPARENEENRDILHQLAESWILSVIEPAFYLENKMYYFEDYESIEDLTSLFRKGYLNESFVCFIKEGEDDYTFHVFDTKSKVKTVVKRARDSALGTLEGFNIHSETYDSDGQNPTSSLYLEARALTENADDSELYPPLEVISSFVKDSEIQIRHYILEDGNVESLSE